MYLALYRKYRPARFSEVAGQQAITETLRRQVAEGKTAHSYLFTGSRGTGKTSCAKILAKAVNCPHAVDGEPCLECDICKGVDNGSLLDVVEMDAASNNGVDQVRLLKEEAVYTPAQSKYRVYIIDEVHMMSTAAFNALLKIMEEPPAHVKFILATTEAHKVPATILSRCQRFDFRRLRPEDIAARLSWIAEQEKAFLDEDAALLIARLADGGMRDAVSMLDQCLSVDARVTTDLVASISGITGSEVLFSLTDDILAGERAGLLRRVDELYRSSKDLSRFLGELSAHFRNLMLLKADAGCRDLLVCSAQELAQYQEQASCTTLSFLLHGIGVLQRALDEMSASFDKKLSVEAALLRLADPKLDDSSPAILHRLEALERLLNDPGFRLSAAPVERSVPAPEKPDFALAPAPEPAPEKPTEQKEEPVSETSPAKEKSPAPPAEEKPLPPKKDKPEPLACWDEVLKALSQSNPPLFGVLSGSAAYDLGAGKLIVDSPMEMFGSMLKKDNYLSSLQQAIEDISGLRYRILTKKKTKPHSADKLASLEQRAQQLDIPVTHFGSAE